MLHKISLKIKYDFKKETDEIESFSEPLNYNHKCPCCGSSDIVRNGKYGRNIVYLKENCILSKSIILQRFLCKKCHKTRTYYPSFVIPRREYSRLLISYILLSEAGIRVLSRAINVSFSQIRKLRKDFRDLMVKLVHLASLVDWIDIDELHTIYERTFLLKAFYPYQRDMALTGIP